MSTTSDRETVIGPGAEFVGEIASRGDFTVQGAVRGAIRHEGLLTIARGGRWEGEIHATVLRIAGEVRGVVEASQRLEILTGGRLFGAVRCAQLVIQDGAVFHGTNRMAPAEGDAARGGTEEPEARTAPPTGVSGAPPVRSEPPAMGHEAPALNNGTPAAHPEAPAMRNGTPGAAEEQPAAQEADAPPPEPGRPSTLWGGFFQPRRKEAAKAVPSGEPPGSS